MRSRQRHLAKPPGAASTSTPPIGAILARTWFALAGSNNDNDACLCYDSVEGRPALGFWHDITALRAAVMPPPPPHSSLKSSLREPSPPVAAANHRRQSSSAAAAAARRGHARSPSWVDKLEDKLPGARTSRAFFTSLSTNLQLAETSSAPQPAPPPSSATHSRSSSTMSASTNSTAPSTTALTPSAPPNPNSSDAALLEIDSRSLTTTTDPSSSQILSALHLIADSVAQRRQSASVALIYSPIVISVFAAFLAFLASKMVHSRGDLPLFFTTAAGITMACLLGVRSAVAGYLDEAERIGVKWLKEDDGEQQIIVTEYGEACVAAIVLAFPRVVGATATSGGRRRKGKSDEPPPVVRVRAWTTLRRYRERGLGRAILEDGVRLARERYGDNVKVVFDEKWAGYKKILPGLFEGGFRRREKRARDSLEKIVKGA